MKMINDQTFDRLCAEMELLKTRAENAEARVRELEKWKAEALELESQWNAQEVGKLLNLTVGSSIRSGIVPAVKKLQKKIEKLKDALEDIGTFAHCVSKAGPLNIPDLATAWGKFDLISVKASSALAELSGRTSKENEQTNVD